jgi:UDP-N-acetylglucosamine 1-carboxyvinyltransferase
MRCYAIKGGYPLKGTVAVNGSKNAALGILAAAIMTDEPVFIDNISDVTDINIMLEEIASLGVRVDRVSRHSVKIDAKHINSVIADDSKMSEMRASYYLIGALLGRFQSAEVRLPGGCCIGTRPIDQHLKGFRGLQAKTEVSNGNLKAHAIALIGGTIAFDTVSVGATINTMLAATLAEGRTILRNVAKEPHIVDVANFLNSMGADIKGAGTDEIRIQGVEKLRGTEYSVIPDQIETGTFMCAAAITGGDIKVTNIIPKHMEAVSQKLIEMGCEVSTGDDFIRVRAGEKLFASDVTTMPYPGFPTDMQPQITTVLSVASGVSAVEEKIFENRFSYVDELVKMGVDIKVRGEAAFISGVSEITGAGLSAPDLRAGAALVLAALKAEGYSTVHNIHFIQRGYERFDEKLRNLGARIETAVIEDLESERKAELKLDLKYGN